MGQVYEERVLIWTRGLHWLQHTCKQLCSYILVMKVYRFTIVHWLMISVPPTIMSSSPQSFHQPLGSTARIYCRAEGSPKPVASWSKDGQMLRISSRVQVSKDGSEITITNLQKQDGGIYMCTFRNVVGLISQNIHLIVEGIICMQRVLCQCGVDIVSRVDGFCSLSIAWTHGPDTKEQILSSVQTSDAFNYR